MEGSKKHNHKDIEFIGFHNVRQMPYNASDMVAVTFPESLFNDDKGPRIYLTGGCSGDQVCDVVNATTDALFCYCPLVNDFASYFSPQESAWTVVAPMLRERYRHMSAKVGKYLYVLGGRYLNDSLVTAVDRLDVLTGVWEFVADWPAATSDGVAWSIEKDNLIMVAGGYDAFYQTPGSLTAFHVLTGQFDAGYPAMAVGRGDTQVATLNGNEFYVIGGWTGDNFVTPSNGEPICSPNRSPRLTQPYLPQTRQWWSCTTTRPTAGRPSLPCTTPAGTWPAAPWTARSSRWAARRARPAT